MKLSPLLWRLWGFITPHRRKQLGFLLILIVVASFMEIVAIGAVLPFLAVLTNPETVYAHDLAQPVISILGVKEASQLMLPLTLGFAAAAVVAGSLRILLLWAQARLGNAMGTDLSFEIYRRCLYQPYSVHVARNSSEVIAAITTKTNQVVGGVINPVIIFLSSTFFMIVILTALVSIEPFVAMIGICGFGLSYGLIVMATKGVLLQNSQLVSLGSNKVVKVVQEGLGGIRDILIDGTQDSYCKAYKAADVPMRRAQANNNVISQAPRYGIEAISMVLIAVIAYSLAEGPGRLVDALPILGAFAIGAQRLLPTLQQLYANYSSIRACHASLQDALEIIEQDVQICSDDSALSPLAFDKSIELRHVYFSYHAAEPWVLNDVNILIPKGLRVGFVGTTGSGKSTLLDIVMGLLHTTKGEIVVDNKVVSNHNYRSWQAHITHVPQVIFLVDAPVAENIAFGVSSDQIDYELVRKCAEQAQIAETIEAWELQYQTPVGERGVRLSGGQRQRIGIARALYKQADVLVFDEATSALDNETEQAVMQAIDNIDKEVTILMVAHRLTTLSSCDQVIELENGKIKRSGTYSDIVG